MRLLTILRSLLAAAACSAAATSGLQSQALNGTVLRADSLTPASGVLVEVRVGRTREPLRVLTNQRGAFRLALPAADTVRVRVLRPGFRPAVHPPVYVAVGATRELRIVLADQPLTLAATTIRESRVCGERADAAAWQLWEQARTVLQTTALTERDTALTVRTIEFQGQATPGGATVIKDSTVAFVPVDPEFPKAHYDSLFQRGYIRRNDDTVTTYYAPNANVLLDERFVRTHCFRVAESDSTPRGMIGVRVEPARSPRHTDIVGTFWLDSATFHLRQIEFGYLNPPRNHRVIGTGGFVIFTRLGTGHWIMSEWSIRMASLVVYREARQRLRREDGTYIMERNGINPLEGFRVTSDYNLWSRNQLIVSVHRGDQLLFHEPTGDTLSARIIPMKPGDPRLRKCGPGERFGCTP